MKEGLSRPGRRGALRHGATCLSRRGAGAHRRRGMSHRNTQPLLDSRGWASLRHPYQCHAKTRRCAKHLYAFVDDIHNSALRTHFLPHTRLRKADRPEPSLYMP